MLLCSYVYTYTFNIGTVNCQTCPPGTYSDSNGTSCELCATGWFNGAFGQSACQQCQAGTFSGQ